MNTEKAILSKLIIKHIYDSMGIEDHYTQFKDALPGTEEHKYWLQDQKSIASFDANKWHYMGIRIEGEIMIPCGPGTWITQTLETPGLWGIESRSGDKYKNDVAKEELEGFKHILKVLNVDTTGAKPFENKDYIPAIDLLFNRALKQIDKDF